MQVLIISTTYDAPSYSNREEIIDALAQPLNEAGYSAETTLFENLVFEIYQSSASIYDTKNKKDLAEYDLVYVKNWKAHTDAAAAMSVYLKSKSIRLLCSEIDQHQYVEKISEGFLFATHHIPYPDTLFAINSSLLLDAMKTRQEFSYPVILKAVDGSAGNDNHLVHTPNELEKICHENPKKRFMVQNFLPNDGDHRIILFGHEPVLAFKRVRKDKTSHLNNTSQGADVVETSLKSYDPAVLEHCRKATKLLRREIAGADVLFDKNNGAYVLLEVNASPQLSTGAMVETKKQLFAAYIAEEAKKGSRSAEKVIGVSTPVDFVGYKNLKSIPARIDTGARTSSLWASDVKIRAGVATFKLFGPGSPWYTGKIVRRNVIELREVTSSTGHTQLRHLVTFPIRMQGKRLNAKFTLSDRSTQTYPVLIGRNTLRGNFLVDSGDPGEARLYKYSEEADEFNESEAV